MDSSRILLILSCLVMLGEVCYVIALPQRQKHHITICQHRSEKLSCPEGMVISVNDGYYGRHDKTTCPGPRIKTTTCSDDRSLNRLRQICDRKNSCKIKATSSLFGDPCIGTYKYVEMTYFCR